MGWSWKIGRIAGIDLLVHPTFLILLAWVGLAHYLARGSPAEALVGLASILSLFGVVVLHELGHALMARRFGIRTRDITLLPIGGVARLERIPEEPAQEVLVALAGPAVNAAIAVAIYLGLALGQGSDPVLDVPMIGGGFLEQMLWVNVMLVAFNLVPAFPMDGGRVLRALLAIRLDYVRATETAVAIGQAIAVVFGLLGLFFNPLLIFIALFVWLAGSQEAGMVIVRSALADLPVVRVMITEFRTLKADDPLSLAAGYALRGFQPDFPVVEGDEPVGILARHDLAAALEHFGPRAPVAAAMQPDFVTATPREMVQSAFDRMQAGRRRTLLVVAGGRLVGLLTADNLSEVLSIRRGLREVDRPGPFGEPHPLPDDRVHAGEHAAGAPSS